MGCRQHHNRRLWAWLLTLALVIMTVPSHAAWQSLDGTPCPFNCPMLRKTNTPAYSYLVPSASHCNKCPIATDATVSPHTDHAAACTKSQCVLQVSERPASTLQDGVKFFAPLLAMPPPAASISPVATETVSTTAPLAAFRSERQKTAFRVSLGQIWVGKGGFTPQIEAKTANFPVDKFLSCKLLVCIYPQRYLHPHPGRAPPACL
jgi:hypothetical protein